jgi:hypothetical protein
VSNFLFLFRAYPDVDHISPLVWKCLERGDRAFVLFDRAFPYERDYRIQFLRRYPGFRLLHLRGVESPSPAMRFASRLVWTASRLERLLRRHAIQTCIFEWGSGLGPRARGRSLTARLAQLPRAGPYSPWRRDVERLVARTVKPLRNALILAAIRSDLPTFALPHGMRTIMNPALNAYVADRMRRHGGEDPQEDQNCFTAYVLNTEALREHMVRYNRLDPRVAQTWGSLRFCPEWRRVVGEICPAAALPPRQPGHLRAVFFLPKWEHFVDEAGTFALLTGLADRPDLQLILKGHPRRGRTDLAHDRLAELARRANVVLAGEAHSSALIDASDVAIVLVSSLAIEALLQRKPVIHAAYLHPNEMVYDGYPGCVTARSQAELHAALDRIRRGTGPQLDDATVARVERDFVYGGRAPFDVPEFYYTRIQSYLYPGYRLSNVVGSLATS